MRARVASDEDLSCLVPNEVRQYIFQLTTTNPIDYQATSPIGRIEIAWRTNFGDSGKLRTNALSRKV